MNVLIVLGFVAVATNVVSSNSIYTVSSEEWNLFKHKFDKVYENFEEELFRKNVYLNNKINIEEHNKRYAEGLVTYRLVMNKFGDLNTEEINAKMNGLKQLLKKDNVNADSVTFQRSSSGINPSSVDWREEGSVTPVKNQGRCGSCWAFSATGSLEGQQFRKTGKLVSLSEQNLIDCSRRFGNYGCNGGLMDNAFQYIKANGGIDTEESYPYVGKQRWCKYQSRNSGATVTGFVDIAEGDEAALQEAVATVGPISVAIDASSPDLHFYGGGVYYNVLCSSTDLDHGVLTVGYNTTASGDDYWIVKNSWGRDWGMEGYILMARNRGNNCGIATMASYPLV